MDVAKFSLIDEHGYEKSGVFATTSVQGILVSSQNVKKPLHFKFGKIRTTLTNGKVPTVAQNIINSKMDGMSVVRACVHSSRNIQAIHNVKLVIK